MDSNLLRVLDVYVTPSALLTVFGKDSQISNSNHFDAELGEAPTRRYQLGDLPKGYHSHCKNYQHSETYNYIAVGAKC